MTISITTTYNLVWRYLESDYYFTKCGKCFNVKRNKELRCVLNGYSKGYTLNGKFEALQQISKKLIKVLDNKCPF